MTGSSRKRRYFGLHMGGPKSDRTCLVVFDVFDSPDKLLKKNRSPGKSDEPTQKFLVDVFDRISSPPGTDPEDKLLKILRENTPRVEQGKVSVTAMGVDAPLTLPPCIGCQLKCPGINSCEVEAVVWLRRELNFRMGQPRRGKRHKPVAPYLERPVDVFLRKYKEEGFGQIALVEALGSTMASKAARLQYMKRHLFSEQKEPEKIPLVEVNPTLSLAMLRDQFELSDRDLKYYRDLQNGAAIRMRILDRLNDRNTVFLYEKDIGTLVSSLPAFYAFLCAYTSYLWDLGRVQAPEGGFPVESGWVAIPT